MKYSFLLLNIITTTLFLTNSNSWAVNAKLSTNSIDLNEPITISGNIGAGKDLFLVICRVEWFSSADINNPKNQKMLQYTFGDTAVPPLYYALTNVPEKLTTSQFKQNVKVNKIQKWDYIDPAIQAMLEPINNEKQWEMITFLHQNKIGINITEKISRGSIAKTNGVSPMILADYDQYPEEWNEGVTVKLDQHTGNFTVSMKSSIEPTTTTAMEVYVNGQYIDRFSIVPNLKSNQINSQLTKAINFLKGNQIRATGSCNHPDQIGLFNQTGALVFYPSAVLFVEPGNTSGPAAFSYNAMFDKMVNNTCKKLLPQHYSMFGEAIAILEASDKIAATCMAGGEEACINTIFQFIDVTGDGQLTVAEVSRVARGLAFFVSTSFANRQTQHPGIPVPFENIYFGTSAIGLLGPMFAKNLIASVDYDDNGKASLDELLQDRGPASLEGGVAAIASTSTEMAWRGTFALMSKIFQQVLGFVM
ncbi:hypothetical protein [Desulfogranum marinum]|uniref:hypothetical protein n=1 Tax=Desulfogranum marinum TaxID=453220 RepID=UPI001963ACDF|nr:hypothetical protein [Desulfogranum marinum]MBM9514876.1 hypothetical protein [Desulfogranum marinum]